jgi:agmatinase
MNNLKETSSHFGGTDLLITDPKNSRVTVIPVPYDATTSYIGGTSKGPAAIIDASAHMELYDEELGNETCRIGIHTMMPLPVKDEKPEAMLRMVSEAVARNLAPDKLPVIVGGEHSISPGAVRELVKQYPRLSVLQLDAHADLRDSYGGTPFSHACAGRRISELCPLVQAGIRSLSRDEADFRRSAPVVTFFDHQVKQGEAILEDVLRHLTDDVYLTVDLDVLDPAIMPATGTPEPGGMSWHEITGLLRKLCLHKRVVAFDVVELSPQPGNVAPDFLAAKLMYRIMGYIAQSRGWI